MKIPLKRVLAFALMLILTMALVLSITACGSLKVNKNSLFTWDPIDGAVEYECAIVDDSGTCAYSLYVTEPCYKLEKGYYLYMRPVFEDGSTGDWCYFGYDGETPISEKPGNYEPATYFNENYDLTVDQTERFELISAIRFDTVQTAEDGLVTFEADGPHGVMRFEAQGVTVENGMLTFQPNGRIWGLDAIGRICAVRPYVSDPGDPTNAFLFSGGYTFNEATSVEHHEDLLYIWGECIVTSCSLDESYLFTDMMNWQPNFIIFGSNINSTDSFSISALEIFYDTTTFTTGIRYMGLDTDFYGVYMTGDKYDTAREVFDIDSNIFTFYLGVVPELQNEYVPYEGGQDAFYYGRAITAITMDQFEIGSLRRADGTAVDLSVPLEANMTIDITLGDYTYPLALPIYEQFRGAQNMNQLVPYAYPEAIGEMNTILIPVAWQDQPEGANDKNLLDLKYAVGRVIENGSVTDYSEQLRSDGRFSLSEYFDIASYNKLNISTFVTDWYTAPFDYSSYKDMSSGDDTFREAIYTWLMDTYPDMDWTDYDKDGNGYFDSVIFVNVGVSDDGYFVPSAFSGGAYHMTTYNGGQAGTPEKPTINSYINVNASLLDDNTLIHEFGHNLGLIDYYDVYYTGIDAVGRFDMQSSSYGDWNSYSKYAAGWITPTVVDLAPGETAEYTIEAFCDSGDTIVIPVHSDSFDGPFNEYIMIDLFTDDGVNTYDAKSFGLKNVSGVRIYHIDSRMESHTEEVNGVSYPLGTPYKVNAYDSFGTFQVELIQAGRDNTFTDLDNLRTELSKKDLFRTGDTFTVKRYAEFFRDGKMDDGSDFPYTIEMVSVSSEKAVIRITAEN